MTDHSIHTQRFAARREAHEREKETAIEPLIFERSKRSPMWQPSTDTKGQPIFTKRFDPPLLAEEENALQRVLVHHHILDAAVLSTPDSGATLMRTIDTQLVSGIQLSAALFAAVRADMIAPTILRDQPDDPQAWELKQTGHPGKEQVTCYSKIFGEALGKKLPNGDIENTLMGEIVQASLEKLGLVRGKDFDWDTNGRGVITSNKAYTDAIAPALAGISKSQPAPSPER